MSANGRGLLLVGSPKTSGSTSEALGTYLAERLAAGGLPSETVRAPALRTPEALAALAADIGEVSLVVLSFPLYVDSVPAVTLRVLEAVAAHRADAPAGPALAVLVNSGFPEVSQSAIALGICRRFAAGARLRWAGGLAVGCGEAIGGQPLESRGGMTRNLRRGLDLAAEALLRGESIPDAAAALLAKPLAPAWVFPVLGEVMWRARAWRHGATWTLRRRPYA